MKASDTPPCTGENISEDVVHAGVKRALSVLGGKWKLEILWLLHLRMHRFNELHRALAGVTPHVLTAQLKELERDGMVHRTVFPVVPPRVEYTLTEKAKRLVPAFAALVGWSIHENSQSDTAKPESHDNHSA